MSMMINLMKLMMIMISWGWREQDPVQSLTIVIFVLLRIIIIVGTSRERS